MFVWRLCLQRPWRIAFDGEGARLYGGRWNQQGTRLVYASATLSLAALELLVHLDPQQIRRPLFSYRAEIPDALIETLPDSRLPGDWRAVPAGRQARVLGSSWAQALTAVALSVPSIIIPHERNYLLNPGHADFGRIVVRQGDTFSFDSRLWR